MKAKHFTEVEITYIAPSSITMLRTRQREAESDITSLMKSISELGILEPIIVDDEMDLIAGFNRLRSAKALDLPKVPVIKKSQLSERHRFQIELEENICRTDLTWSEKVMAAKKLHDLMKEEDISWGHQDTADLLKRKSVGHVSEDLELAEKMEEFPELKDAPNRAFARRKLLALDEQAILKELERRNLLKSDVKLINADSLLFLPTLCEGSVDMVLMDPPYGREINLVNSKEAIYENHVEDFEEYEKLFQQLLPMLYRVMKDGSHCYIFFSIEFFPELHALCKRVFKHVSCIPLVWDKGIGVPPSVAYDFTNCYESILFMSKGMKPLYRPTQNIFHIKPVPLADRRHTNHKPHELLAQLIEASSQKGDLVLDPFSGSGQTAISAHLLGRKGLGIERDEKTWKVSLAYAKESLSVKTL
jgi:ParB/RepB/Spo0J family partition protein